MGCLRERDLWRLCTCHPNNGARPRGFDSCGNRLSLDELRRHSLRGPVCANGNARLRSCIVVSRQLPPSALTPASTSAACGYVPHGQWAPLDADTPALIDRSARLVELFVLLIVFLLLPSWCWPHQARLAPSPRSPLANAHREALLKVLSLVRAARSKLLCRYRRFTATASSTPSLEDLSLHFVLHNCCDLGLPLRCICQCLQLLRLSSRRYYHGLHRYISPSSRAHSFCDGQRLSPRSRR